MPGHSSDALHLPAAGVVPAAGAGVAGAGPLHHVVALLAGRAELAALQLGWDHGRGVGERRGRWPRLARGAVPVAARMTVSLPGSVSLVRAVVEQQALLRLAPRADLGGEDAEGLQHIRVGAEAAPPPTHPGVRQRLRR